MIDAETVAEIIIANAYIEFQHGVPCICYKNGDKCYVRVEAKRMRKYIEYIKHDDILELVNDWCSQNVRVGIKSDALKLQSHISKALSGGDKHG